MARYRILPDRSKVWIEARSSLHPINSCADGLEGYVELDIGEDGRLDPAGAPAARLSFPVERLRSGNRMEDRELQKRIDARRYPTIDGILSAIAPADGDGTYKVQGEVIFRGISRTHEDHMTIEMLDKQRIRLSGKSRFDVRQFGMEPPKILMLRVEPEVDVRVEILAEKEG